MVARDTSVSAFMLALRPSWSSRDISPNESPGPSFRDLPWTVVTVTVPSRMTMNPTPFSPLSTISCPAGGFTVFICFSMERSSGSGRPSNSFACLTSVTVQILTPGLFAVQKLLVEAIRVLFPAVHDFGVTLERVEVRVAQHFLDQPNIAAGHLEQGGGCGVARNVWR